MNIMRGESRFVRGRLGRSWSSNGIPAKRLSTTVRKRNRLADGRTRGILREMQARPAAVMPAAMMPAAVMPAVRRLC